ncbi:hypothetical protein C5B42_03235 [Candidatus Cerribacteria bacterium 'Amazon FNV 2010 28 9']|uniref:Uncharacterized protein n=1 Tax=Candidatus Cerribacteria bacterium 'Amazon FNV 2010 28 9' TaxID=2081795 RepID=A0A317JPS5_9BACT|nr:MAG: hypothetical protein C5B42_03235 [Candidatus Cerribacteria bacterium 'Amazon FNV 2010 28 9']
MEVVTPQAFSDSCINALKEKVKKEGKSQEKYLLIGDRVSPDIRAEAKRKFEYLQLHATVEDSWKPNGTIVTVTQPLPSWLLNEVEAEQNNEFDAKTFIMSASPVSGDPVHDEPWARAKKLSEEFIRGITFANPRATATMVRVTNYPGYLITVRRPKNS